MSTTWGFLPSQHDGEVLPHFERPDGTLLRSLADMIIKFFQAGSLVGRAIA